MKIFKFIRRLILIIIIFSIVIFGGYGYFLSPNDYGFKKYEYTHKNISSQLNGFKIAFISDLNLNNK